VKPIVADNSALVPLFLPDEAEDYSQALLELVLKGAAMKSASFCQIEFGNVIATSVRRKRLTQAEAAYAHKKFSELPVEFVDYVTAATMPAIHDLALRRDLSFYDALYLALAMEEGAKLATLDQPLRKAAQAEGVEVL
jgi:predicted nucleic acid-binding protein